MAGEWIIMKLRLFIIIALLLLQACQHNNEATNAGKKTSLSDAAAYNTQLGLAYLKQGNRARAKHKLFLALNQAPDSAAVNAAMAYFMEKSGELNEARAYYKKAMMLAPGEGAQLNNYGTFLCRQGHYKQAEAYFLKAVNDIKYEHTAGAYENAGLCAMEAHEQSKAVHFFASALKQDPARPQSLYQLIAIKMKQNHTHEALVYLQKYPELTYDHPALLSMAIEVAQKAGKSELAANYQMRLQSFSDKTGGKDEYNNNNG